MRAMDSLSHLLSRKDFDEPPEIKAIKNFVRDTFQADVNVQVRERDIVIIVPGASLASRLRFAMPALKEAAGTDKRIVLRIS